VSLEKLNGRLLILTPGSERKEHLPATSGCQESCQTGRKKWWLTLEPRLAYRPENAREPGQELVL